MLANIVKALVASYGDLDALARVQPVSGDEVAAALAKAKPDTAEFIVLTALARYHKPTPKVAAE